MVCFIGQIKLAKEPRVGGEPRKKGQGWVCNWTCSLPTECHLWGGCSKRAAERCSVTAKPRRKGTDLS